MFVMKDHDIVQRGKAVCSQMTLKMFLVWERPVQSPHGTAMTGGDHAKEIVSLHVGQLVRSAIETVRTMTTSGAERMLLMKLGAMSALGRFNEESRSGLERMSRSR